MLEDLNDRQREFRSLAAEVAKEVYAPRALEWDQERTLFPDVERKRLADLGFLGISMPEEHGGLGLPLLDSLIVIEELAKECRPAAFQVFEANTGPARHIALLGTDEQKAEVLPKVVAGEATVAVAISEPDAGLRRHRHEHALCRGRGRAGRLRWQALDQRRRPRRLLLHVLPVR